ncbi:MAG: hypothetical protein K2H86_06795 [Muribaculaceae bacterium]|nr:hypothetical protein [Muribaculaceae bacterium]
MNIGKLSLLSLAALAPAVASASAPDEAPVYVVTQAYRWQGDTLYQDEFKAWAVSPYEIHSTYKGRPGYFMPVEQTWRRKNNLDAYPLFKTDNSLLQAVYNMGLDEMVNAVEPDTTLRTGKEWAGVWTRDVSYSIILSMAALQPEASMISLMKKVNAEGQIIQDTGSGGAWPVSTDRMIWTLAAWELYKVTGSRQWLEKVYPIVVRSMAKDDATIYSERGLVKGETSFIDWREQSYPRWMQTADISQSEAMSTNVLYCAALTATSDMATILGDKKAARDYADKAERLARNIEKVFDVPGEDYWGMYTYGVDNKVLNPRAETLGESLAILYDVATPERQRRISQGNPVTPYGPAIFFPQISDIPNYHNNALWPFVASYWALAQAKAGNEQGVVEGIGSVVRPAALFATNKENFNLDNGDYFTELNSSNMLWSLSGNIALTNRILFGLNFDKDGLRVAPFVPKAFEGVNTLENFPYRGGRLNITVKGYGDRVASMTLDGKSVSPTAVIPAGRLKGDHTIVVQMADEPIPAMALNRTANVKAPLTPIAWLENEGAGQILRWNPIEYIARYKVLRDGEVVGETRTTSWDASLPGEWQVIGVNGDGVESFASQPRDNRPLTVVQAPSESTVMTSTEVSYQPSEPIAGYTGEGWVEIDRQSKPVVYEVEVPEDGEFMLSVHYANGNGPVNTENKAAIRSVLVDGVDVGTIVMPTRGVANWNDWGSSSSVRVPLTAGHHHVSIVYNPEDSNMNYETNHALLDRLDLRRR